MGTRLLTASSQQSKKLKMSNSNSAAVSILHIRGASMATRPPCDVSLETEMYRDELEKQRKVSSM